jgi:hypothetical protein
MLTKYTTRPPRAANHAQRVVDTIACTGRCAGCNAEFTERNPAVGGGVVIEPQGMAGYQLCGVCEPRWHGDRKFRACLRKEAYRTIFGAGPDSVGGAA